MPTYRGKPGNNRPSDLEYMTAGLQSLKRQSLKRQQSCWNHIPVRRAAPRPGWNPEIEAARMRANPTPAEALLWEHLDQKRLGWVFLRQVVHFGYVLDFVCKPLKLVIELDGWHHTNNPDQRSHDGKRDAALESHGFRVMRFRNKRVLEELDYVLAEIARVIEDRKANAL